MERRQRPATVATNVKALFDGPGGPYRPTEDSASLGFAGPLSFHDPRRVPDYWQPAGVSGVSHLPEPGGASDARSAATPASYGFGSFEARLGSTYPGQSPPSLNGARSRPERSFGICTNAVARYHLAHLLAEPGWLARRLRSHTTFAGYAFV